MEVTQDTSSRVFPLLPSGFRRSLPLPPTVQAAKKKFYPMGHLTADVATGSGGAGGLIPLPREYTELLQRASQFSCPNSVTGESKDPALCLVCGLMVCSNSLCCEDTVLEVEPGSGGLAVRQPVGGCTAHARVCCAGTGVFLKVSRKCKVKNSKRGSCI